MCTGLHRRTRGRLVEPQTCVSVARNVRYVLLSPDRPFADNMVDTGLVLSVLEPIWSQKPETASRVRQRIERVLSWAKVRGLREGENPAQWRGHLDQLLPAKGKVRRVRHLAALPFGEIGRFMAVLREDTSISARALEITILTAARTSEMLGRHLGRNGFQGTHLDYPSGADESPARASRTTIRPSSGDLTRTIEDTAKRLRLSWHQAGSTAVANGDVDASATNGLRAYNDPRLQIELSRLDGGMHQFSARSRRDGACACPARP